MIDVLVQLLTLEHYLYVEPNTRALYVDASSHLNRTRMSAMKGRNPLGNQFLSYGTSVRLVHKMEKLKNKKEKEERRRRI